MEFPAVHVRAFALTLRDYTPQNFLGGGFPTPTPSHYKI